MVIKAGGLDFGPEKMLGPHPGSLSSEVRQSPALSDGTQVKPHGPVIGTFHVEGLALPGGTTCSSPTRARLLLFLGNHAALSWWRWCLSPLKYVKCF